MELTPEKKNKLGRIGVLMGGPSSEREISFKSGKAVVEALSQLGLETAAIDIKSDNIRETRELLKSSSINCAFIALHGYFGEDGQVQRILDELKIPYTSSGAMASKLAMDKIASHEIFQVNGINIPKYKALNKGYFSPASKANIGLGYPLVIKPATHGSSIGLSIVDKREDLDKALDLAFGFDENILVEEYVHGREVTVAVLDELALPVIEIIPKNRFFDYEAKYQPGKTTYVMPAEIDEKLAAKVRDTALKTHKLLGCSGCSRVDMILDKDNNVIVLEVNTVPGLTQTSLLPKAAKLAGIEFNQLCLKLVELAYEKTAKAMGAGR
ncbi:MAG: D-alanine--D-alanine ligase [Candidatus Omnitrophica bacterium]|nr:D-alanine--D-alanine ligase [Candidatus Omnitrophota bacterium]